MAQYWYNVETHEVEKDAQSDWQKLIGPYETRAEAEAAPERVRARNEAADAFDEDDDE
ncbi:SPOR domain-containing protein [Arthrobacter stackebrandtii]|nr:SPOR domain-containing protein [Arthrobacter stackebrandtii]